MERAKQIAISFFSSLGYSVAEIPEADNKRADLDVHDGEHQYIVEVKEKLDTGSQMHRFTEGEGNSKVHVGREPHSRSNRLDGVLKHGTKQLNETPSSDDAFNLLWLHTDGMNADMTSRRALYTFYGVATLIPVSQRGDGVNCVYFDYSTAFAAPSVNGLIVVENDSLQLCLNEFSPNYGTFRTSKLVTELGTAIYDPSHFENKDGTTGIRYTRMELNRYTFGK
ncbi:MAG: hypothetical protein FD138_3637 [Planctomycetota bacterium]|nr:MAG: hypothetical protein FD138_3637 [Planctomycetota bacterium]